MRKLSFVVAIVTLLAPLLVSQSAWAQGGKPGMRGVRAGASSVARIAKPSGGMRSAGRNAVRLQAPRGGSVRGGMPDLSAFAPNGRVPGAADLADQALRRGPEGSPMQRRGVRTDLAQGRYSVPRGGYQGLIDPALLGQLAQYYNLPGGGYGYQYDDLYRHLYGYENRASKDYRDAAIASAIVNMVGMLAATAIQQQPGAGLPVAVGPPASGPVLQAPVAVSPGPAYERQQVVVREGYYETAEVWVPEYQDANGTTVEGHHEVLRRWVPPVYETREIRVR